MNIVITTGWHSSGKSPNVGTSQKVYQKEWLAQWLDYHTVNNAAYSIYISKCPVFPDGCNKFNNISVATLANNYYHTRHDWSSSVLSGALYAYNNNLDFVYIEQDCFVYGLEKAVSWAKQEKVNIAYGTDQHAFAQGWAENSFTFVDRQFVPTFIERIVSTQIDRISKRFIELLITDLFGEDVTPWPFGFGRKLVTDWTQEIFYKQQLTDDDINRFMDLKNA